MAAKMEFTAAAGHACSLSFHMAKQLRDHPEFIAQKDLLRDMDSEPWTTFAAAK
jgi:hypothetical protein